MEIRHRQSNFSQFSNDLWLIVEHENTQIYFDVDQKELLAFANSLIDIAVDCLRKSKKETEAVDDLLCSAIDEISKIDAEPVEDDRATATTTQT